MTNHMLYRVSGISAIIGLLVLLSSDFLSPQLVGVGTLVTAVFYYGLIRMVSSETNKVVSLGVVFLVIIGSIVIFLTGRKPGLLLNLALFIAINLPALVGGLVTLGKPGFPQILSYIGIIAGGFGFLNLVVNVIGGGDWTNLSNPALQPISNVTYYLATVALIVWLIWGGLLLFRKS